MYHSEHECVCTSTLKVTDRKLIIHQQKEEKIKKKTKTEERMRKVRTYTQSFGVLQILMRETVTGCSHGFTIDHPARIISGVFTMYILYLWFESK